MAPTEAKKWLERLKVSPNDALCSEVAGRLTKIRWPSDDPSSPVYDETETDQCWDFQAAIKAANTLNTSIPAMLSHWDGLRLAPETRGGHEAITALKSALALALPYIEFPFGKYERKTHGPRQHPEWHMGAIVIASIFIEAEIQSGGNTPNLHRNSRLIKVVHEAMGRMSYMAVTDTAISQCLKRWVVNGGALPIGNDHGGTNRGRDRDL